MTFRTRSIPCPAPRATKHLQQSGAHTAVPRAARPPIENFANFSDEAIVVFDRLLKQDPTMSRLLALFKAEGYAEGYAEGFVTTLLDCVADGDITHERARVILQRWADQREISEEQLQTALTTLREMTSEKIPGGLTV